MSCPLPANGCFSSALMFVSIRGVWIRFLLTLHGIFSARFILAVFFSLLCVLPSPMFPFSDGLLISTVFLLLFLLLWCSSLFGILPLLVYRPLIFYPLIPFLIFHPSEFPHYNFVSCPFRRFCSPLSALFLRTPLLLHVSRLNLRFSNLFHLSPVSLSTHSFVPDSSFPQLV